MTTSYNLISSRPSHQVDSQGRLIEMPIPALHTSFAFPDSGYHQAAQPKRLNQYDLSDTYIDPEDAWYGDYDPSVSAYGSHCYHPEMIDESPDEDEFVIEVIQADATRNSSELMDFAREHHGTSMATSPYSICDDEGSKAWVDWNYCITIWKQTLPASVVAKVDWSKINPSDYLVDRSGNFVLAN